MPKKRLVKEALSEQERALRKQRGERARVIRKALKLTRAYLKKNYDLSSSTLQSWEDEKFGGMAESSAQTLAAIYQAEGLKVTPEWLMYGVGDDPLVGLKLGDYTLTKNVANEKIFPTDESSITQELKIFHELNKNAVHLLVEDDGLSPWLMPGDYVAGKWLFAAEINQAIDFPCIVETESGEKLVRLVRAGDCENEYTLLSTNSKAIAANSILKNNKLLAAAPIIRIWKIKPSGKF